MRRAWNNWKYTSRKGLEGYSENEPASDREKKGATWWSVAPNQVGFPL